MKLRRSFEKSAETGTAKEHLNVEEMEDEMQTADANYEDINKIVVPQIRDYGCVSLAHGVR